MKHKMLCCCFEVSFSLSFEHPLQFMLSAVEAHLQGL